MANALIKGRAAIWGIETTAGDTYVAGIIVDMTHDKDGDTDFVLDGQGFVIAEALFNDQDVCDINVICESGTALPDRGDDIQIAGYACIVQSCGEKWNQKGWKAINVKAKKFVNLT